MVTSARLHRHQADYVIPAGDDQQLSANVALHASQGTQPNSLEYFALHCWARARLYWELQLSLHEAVDVLQQHAECSGLVKLIGQDAVQAIMASQFGAFQC